MISVFVYGTLRSGQSARHRIEPYILECNPGSVTGYLYNAGAWPGLVIDPQGEEIAGEWLLLKEEALPIMDEWEDYYGPEDSRNDYERIWTRDSRQSYEGWVYIWKNDRDFPRILSNSWV
ncbi:gamma-glutamylcyclotransferase family protein [Paenibacillus turpanensis]|uniref:gamma-glutamylcyclotransferase family protein n=1 Tax=Paenibacillus turpanensis TaxID=2689078 RepID=UPI00140AC324|nr:gamma-glutamylcyclotransferase family protein [Paenibacillus turpanensis]